MDESLTTTCRYVTQRSWGSGVARYCGKPTTEMVAPYTGDRGEPLCRQHMAPVRRSYRKDRISPIDQATIDAWVAFDTEMKEREERNRIQREQERRERERAWTVRAKQESSIVFVIRKDVVKGYHDEYHDRWLVVPEEQPESDKGRSLGLGAEVTLLTEYGEPRIELRASDHLSINEAKGVVEALTRALLQLEAKA